MNGVIRIETKRSVVPLIVALILVVPFAATTPVILSSTAIGTGARIAFFGCLAFTAVIGLSITISGLERSVLLVNRRGYAWFRHNPVIASRKRRVRGPLTNLRYDSMRVRRATGWELAFRVRLGPKDAFVDMTETEYGRVKELAAVG